MNKILKHIILIIALLQGNYKIIYAQRWQSFGLILDRPITCFYSDTSENILYVGGEFKTVNSTYVHGIIKIDNTGFHPLGMGVGNESTPFVNSVIKYKNNIYVGGNFIKSDSTRVNSIAMWNGIRWDSLQSGIIDTTGGLITQGFLTSMVIYNNELCVGGTFQYAGGKRALSVARWNGTTWSDIYGYPGYITNQNEFYFIYTMASFNNELYVAGSILDSSSNKVGIMKWNGINWELPDKGILGNQSVVYCMAMYKDELYVGGCFCKADGNIGNGIQKWNGHEWKEVGGGVTLTNYYFSAVKGMAVINDRLYITGDFDKAGFLPVHALACWDGIKWCTIYDVFSTHVWAFSEYKNNLVLGGNFEINNDSSLSYLVEYLEPSFTDTCSQPFRVPENANESKISVYPNPVKDYLYINLESEINEVSIQIYDIEGRMVTDENLKSSSNIIKIDTKALSYGTYFVKLISNTINGTSLFIKQ